MANTVNREYKSSLFTYMLSQKQYALSVYNALNYSNYTNPDDVEITTLENVVFINIKNDVSFVLDHVFNLYEHQSPYNPNMPLRTLLYLANSYERMINQKEANIYGSALIKIPTPKFIVFYNGDSEYPDRLQMFLSDAFENSEVQADVELKVTMLNISYNHNRNLLEQCEVLRAYSLYNDKFKEYTKRKGITKTEAANMAIEYCIQNNVLADFFKTRRSEVVGMVLEFTAEKAEKYLSKLEKEIEESNQQIEEKERQIQESNQRIEEKERQIKESNQQIEEKERQIKENNQQIRNQNQQLECKEQQIEELNQELAEKNRQILEMEQKMASLINGNQ